MGGQIGLVFALVIFLMIARVPVGIAFGAGGLILMAWFDVDPQWAFSNSFKTINSFVFMAVPLYILLGTLLSQAGAADRLVRFIVAVIGRFRGGLGSALIVSNAFFGAMSGAAASALGGFGKAFVPAMEKEGYPRNYSIGLLIPASVLSMLIPPSAGMIIFGFMGRLPITHCFLAPAIPGLILTVLLITVHIFMCRRVPTIKASGISPGRLPYLKNIGKEGKKSFLVLMVPVITLGGIYSGILTPTEAAGAASLYVIIIAFVFLRSLTLKGFFNVMLDTAVLTGSVVIMFFFFIALSKVLVMANVSATLLTSLQAVSDNKWIVMILLNLLMLVMGMIMDDASGLMIAAVLLLPISTSIGFDPYHFTAIVAVNLGLGLLTPPVALLLYLGGRVAGNLPLQSYIKYVMAYSVFAFLPTLILTIAIPQLSTFLPHLLMGGAQ